MSAASAPDAGPKFSREAFRFVLAAAAVGFLVRAAIGFIASDELRDDATYYVSAASDLAEGRGYLLHGHPTAYWPVGYPAFLAFVFRASGGSLDAARWAQIGIATASIFLASAIARRLLRRDAPAVAVAWLMALSPAACTYSSVFLGETLLTGLMLAGAWFLLSPHRAAVLAGGLCWGAAALVRPTALPLPLLVVLFGVPGSLVRRSAQIAVVCGVVALICLPWLMRNQRVLGHPVGISTNGGVNLWMGHHENATGGYGFTPEMAAASARIGDEVRFDRFARDRALQFIREHPAEALRGFMKKAVLLWSPDHTGGDAVFPRTRSVGRKVSAILSDVFHLVLIAGLVLALVQKRDGIRLPLAILVCFTILYGAIVAMPRYLFPAMPWLMIAAASVVDRRKEAGWKPIESAVSGSSRPTTASTSAG